MPPLYTTVLQCPYMPLNRSACTQSVAPAARGSAGGPSMWPVGGTNGRTVPSVKFLLRWVSSSRREATDQVGFAMSGVRRACSCAARIAARAHSQVSPGPRPRRASSLAGRLPSSPRRRGSPRRHRTLVWCSWAQANQDFTNRAHEARGDVASCCARWYETPRSSPISRIG